MLTSKPHCIQRTRSSARLLGAVVVLLGLVTGCSSTSTEDEIRLWATELQQAAEQTTIAPFRAAVADGYTDNHGHDREAIINITRGVLLARRPLNVFRKDLELTVLDDDSAILTSLVVGAKVPVKNVDSARKAGVDFAWMKLKLSKNTGDWQVVGAQWRAASADELL